MSVPTIITTGPENDKPDSRTTDPTNVSPPSPTLSNVDHRFDTATTLRSNNPNAQSGAQSLALLTPGGIKNRGDGSSHSAETEPATPLSPAQTGTTALDSSSEKVAHIDPSQDTTDPTPFGFQPIKLASLVDPKSLESLIEMGGTDAIIKGLGTHRTRGLSSDLLTSEDASNAPHPAPAADLEKQHPADDASPSGGAFTANLADRHRVYGANVLPVRASKSLLYLMWLALKDKVLVLLCVAAVVSLALGLYSDFGTKRELIECADSGLLECYAPQVEWVEGVAIMVAVVIVVVVGSLNDWQKERQFRALNDKKEDRTVKVIRDGAEKVINIRELVVGDVALLEPGEIIPVDGIFLRGHNVKCDESGATGESDAIKKSSYEDCMEEKNAAKPGDRLKKDCFLISGGKVLEGVGEYVVIAVGQKSFNGRILMALRGDTESTPLQLKLNALAGLIAILGSIAGGILFFALMIRFFVNLAKKPNRTANEKAMNFVDILIISVTLIVVAVPEGLPLAVTLALAFATKRMTGENLLVRVLGSCETMANASVVCTDKTGTLTTNVMTVIAGSVGVHAKFAQNLQEHTDRTNVDKVEDESDPKGDSTRHRNDFSVDMRELGPALSASLKKVFNEGIAVNSTAFEDKDPLSGELEFVGSKTETALLRFAKEQGWDDYKATRDSAEIVQMIPFSSERKCMGVVVKVGNKYRLHLKGASEILTNKCTRHVVVHKPGAARSVLDDEVETKELEEVDRVNINRTIIFYANRTLRTIAVCYREFESWPPRDFTRSIDADNNDVPLELLLNDLTMIAITAIEDPLRPGVREAVANCARAGVVVKMCTGDNVLTARSIARQCGIFTPGGIVMEGPVFRKLSDKEMTEIVPRLQVLARSSPEDKKILVEKLKSLGEIVGVTGDGTNDGPALKTANVGFSMGIAGTEVAKEASDIILMDDNFASIVSAIKWGRCVNDAVRKFLQFQISVNITAVIITFVSAVASDEEESVLTAVQLLWINIIMDTFAALALATDPAADEMLDRKPDRITAPLFTTDMRKQIIGQSIYQTAVILIFHFLADQIFGYDKTGKTSSQINLWHAEMKTLVFNAFVFAQIFNSINSRRIDQKKNVFAGIHRNWYFIIITMLEVAIQVLICFVGGDAFSVSDMSGRSWGVSIALGFVSLPLGFLIRLIPNPPIERFFIKIGLMQNPEVLPTQSPEKEEWNQAIDKVRDDLRSFANIRGGRVRASSFVRKSRSQRLADAGVQLPSLLAMVPTLVMSSVGAGWQPQRGDISNPAGSDPSKSSTALFEGKIQMHPETPADDPFFAKYGPRKSQDLSV